MATKVTVDKKKEKTKVLFTIQFIYICLNEKKGYRVSILETKSVCAQQKNTESRGSVYTCIKNMLNKNMLVDL